MHKFEWIAYGLDMEEDVLLETEGVDIHDSHRKALEELEKRGIRNWDTVELAESVKERTPKIWSNTCKTCGSGKIRSEEYDAYYCPNCNKWLEGACSDPECSFCVERPERPLP